MSVFNNKTLINEVAQRPGIPDRYNAINILTAVMYSLSTYCVDYLMRGIGVIIPGFGYIFFQNSFDSKAQKATRELQFAFDSNFIYLLNLKIPISYQVSTYQAGNMPMTDKYGPLYRLNFVKIGAECGYDYQDCMEGFYLFIEEIKRVIRQGRDGSIDFHIGHFTVKNYNAKWVYDPVFLKILKASGIYDVVKTSYVMTGGKTFRPCDHYKADYIIYK